MTFLRTCTEPVEPIEYSFTALNVPELGNVKQLEHELQRRFGGRSHPTGDRQRIAISPSQVGDALTFLDDVDPQPTNQWGMAPVWFWISSKFRILDPATGRALPGQAPERYTGVEYESSVPLGSSGLRLMLDKGAKIALELCIPDPDNQVLGRVVPWIQANLPCRLSPKQWRAWTPTKSGSLKARRITLSQETELD